MAGTKGKQDRMTNDRPSGPALPLRPDLVRVLAPNPSPMTLDGTNSYVLGTGVLAVIDPGPDHSGHLDSVMEVIAGRPVSHIIVTHSHLDHSPLAARLSAAVSAPVLAFGDSRSGRRPVMETLAASGLAGGGEGVDHAFQPDRTVTEGDRIDGPDWALDVLHTPGHFGNHICLAWGDALFTGDHVMGWSTSLVSPPDGDMTAFLHSCAKVADWAGSGFPGHGDPVTSVGRRAQALIAHRRGREGQILAALEAGAATAASLARLIYTDLAPALLPAAERNIFAHLLDLVERNSVACSGPLAIDARFSLI